ncbi:hypothetical protein TruAng_001678 [Truncatella angustata]|nr:hypothetical protein TruAng_001678 [Truncatella angustata]
MVCKLAIKVPLSPYTNAKPWQSAQQRPSGSRGLRDSTDYNSPCHSPSSDTKCKGNDEHGDGSMLPSPGERSSLGYPNAFSSSSLFESFPSSFQKHNRKPVPFVSPDSSSPRSSSASPAASRARKDRWGGLWIRIPTSSPLRETVVEVRQRESQKWETMEETLLKLKQEEEELEQSQAAQRAAVLEKLWIMGVHVEDRRGSGVSNSGGAEGDSR